VIHTQRRLDGGLTSEPGPTERCSVGLVGRPARLAETVVLIDSLTAWVTGGPTGSVRRCAGRTRPCWPGWPCGFAVIGDTQFLPGYCLLLTDDSSVDRLLDLPRPRRLAFLADMDLIGEAVQLVCRRRDPQFRRINYAILGNTDAYLHAHINARYTWKPPDLIGGPVTRYPAATRTAPDAQLGPHHDDLRAALATEILRLAGLPPAAGSSSGDAVAG
jgi:diadenosine tetraphosphate (Ap4A) HIT family hydrolase